MTLLTSDFHESHNYIMVNEMNGEVVNEALVTAFINVKDRFNINMVKEVGGAHANVRQTINNASTSGDTAYDIVYNHDMDTVSSALNGAYLDIKSMPLVNLDKPWWTRSSKEFQVNNKLYFTASYLGVMSPYMNITLYYNKDMAKEEHITIPYEDIIEGKWYIEELITMTKGLSRDINSDGVMNESDRYAYVTSYFGNMSAQANLIGNAVSKNSKGKFVVTDDQTKYISYMENMDKLMEEGIYSDADGKSGYNNTIFSSERALFMYAETRVLYNIRESLDFDFGVLPYPKMDENQKEYSSAGFDIFWGVNRACSDNVEAIATVIEAMSCQNYNNVYPVIWETVLGLRLADSPEDSAVVAILRDATFVNFDYTYSQQLVGLGEIINVYNTTETGNIASFLTQKLKQIKASLKVFEANLENLE